MGWGTPLSSGVGPLVPHKPTAKSWWRPWGWGGPQCGVGWRLCPTLLGVLQSRPADPLLWGVGVVVVVVGPYHCLGLGGFAALLGSAVGWWASLQHRGANTAPRGVPPHRDPSWEAAAPDPRLQSSPSPAALSCVGLG